MSSNNQESPSALTLSFLRQRATHLMLTFCNDHSDATFTQLLPLIHPSFQATHDDWPSADWSQFTTTLGGIIAQLPEFHCEVKDVIGEVREDEQGGRAWVFSRITGHPAGEVDSVDMMEFDRAGLLISTKDVQRKVSTAP